MIDVKSEVGTEKEQNDFSAIYPTEVEKGREFRERYDFRDELWKPLRLLIECTDQVDSRHGYLISSKNFGKTNETEFVEENNFEYEKESYEPIFESRKMERLWEEKIDSLYGGKDEKTVEERNSVGSEDDGGFVANIRIPLPGEMNCEEIAEEVDFLNYKEGEIKDSLEEPGWSYEAKLEGEGDIIVFSTRGVLEDREKFETAYHQIADAANRFFYEMFENYREAQHEEIINFAELELY